MDGASQILGLYVGVRLLGPQPTPPESGQLAEARGWSVALPEVQLLLTIFAQVSLRPIVLLKTSPPVDVSGSVQK